MKIIWGKDFIMMKGYIAIMTYGKSKYACEISEPYYTL